MGPIDRHGPGKWQGRQIWPGVWMGFRFPPPGGQGGDTSPGRPPTSRGGRQPGRGGRGLRGRFDVFRHACGGVGGFPPPGVKGGSCWPLRPRRGRRGEGVGGNHKRLLFPRRGIGGWGERGNLPPAVGGVGGAKRGPPPNFAGGEANRKGGARGRGAVGVPALLCFSSPSLASLQKGKKTLSRFDNVGGPAAVCRAPCGCGFLRWRHGPCPGGGGGSARVVPLRFVARPCMPPPPAQGPCRWGEAGEGKPPRPPLPTVRKSEAGAVGRSQGGR